MIGFSKGQLESLDCEGETILEPILRSNQNEIKKSLWIILVENHKTKGLKERYLNFQKIIQMGTINLPTILDIVLSVFFRSMKSSIFSTLTFLI